jgi:hypothetical protein
MRTVRSVRRSRKKVVSVGGVRRDTGGGGIGRESGEDIADAELDHLYRILYQRTSGSPPARALGRRPPRSATLSSREHDSGAVDVYPRCEASTSDFPMSIMAEKTLCFGVWGHPGGEWLRDRSIKQAACRA